MPDNQPQRVAVDALPEIITRYLDAHRARDTGTAITTGVYH
ncbi:hypothetical protein [Actinopolymorpha rutila]|uniref:Uncharacterized protein n=1 Tax=Actinopolymorpha rutila TaxID=446787 RepID=A0A852ZKR2_9ACTN|nr:hypothetical protein [Actinopolymorpha rutila]NYH92488.1 hypothetical protein [Actinopolymorpha rutila]